MLRKAPNRTRAEDICLACGLCCNGVIFANVKLQPGDDASRLQSLGLHFSHTRPGRAPRFQQPCLAFDGCRCRIYAQRPEHCREFECLLLKSIHSGQRERSAALELIRTAKAQAELVLGLLRKLGDSNEDLALNTRFRRTSRRLEEGKCDGETASLFGDLTLAVQDLNLLLSEFFYR